MQMRCKEMTLFFKQQPRAEPHLCKTHTHDQPNARHTNEVSLVDFVVVRQRETKKTAYRDTPRDPSPQQPPPPPLLHFPLHSMFKTSATCLKSSSSEDN